MGNSKNLFRLSFWTFSSIKDLDYFNFSLRRNVKQSQLLNY